MTSATIDVDMLAERARALVVRLLGEDSLESLVGMMLDYEVSPTFLWSELAPPVTAAAARLGDELRPSVAALAGEDLEIVAMMSNTLIFDSDPARGLLELATPAGYFAIPPSLLEAPSPDSRVLTALPALGLNIDSRGLLVLDKIFEPAPDVLFVRDWAVPYHQFLRRGFGSRVNDVLLAQLLKLWRAGLSVRVAVDERRLHPRSEHRRFEERDYWSGPPLTDTWLDDARHAGPDIRWHGWPAGVQLLPWETAGDHVAVRASLTGATRTIEIEEVTADVLERYCDVQLVRYVHAERDIERHVFTHLDGAVRYYDRSVYEARRIIRWPTVDGESPSGRRKVFRVDGDMDTAPWVEVVASWFRGNRLVLEALEGLAPGH